MKEKSKNKTLGNKNLTLLKILNYKFKNSKTKNLKTKNLKNKNLKNKNLKTKNIKTKNLKAKNLKNKLNKKFSKNKKQKLIRKQNYESNKINFINKLPKTPHIWWDKNTIINYKGNIKLLVKRIEISIALQSDQYIKSLAHNLLLKLLRIIKDLAKIVNFTETKILKSINICMNPNYPGSIYVYDILKNFTINNNYISRIYKLNFRETNQFFNAIWNCKIKKSKTPILTQLLLKYEELLLNKELNINNSFSKDQLNNEYKSKEFDEFYSRLSILNAIFNNGNKLSVDNTQPLCKSYSKYKDEKYCKDCDINKEDKTPLTITNYDLINRNIPLSINEKKMLKYGSDNKKNIGWYSGFSRVYFESGEMFNHAIKEELNIASGLSGSSWKYLQIIYCLNLNVHDYFYLIIAFINGCFHHSVYEIVLIYNDFIETFSNNPSLSFYIKNSISNIKISKDYEKNYEKYIISDLNDKCSNKTINKIKDIINLYK